MRLVLVTYCVVGLLSVFHAQGVFGQVALYDNLNNVRSTGSFEDWQSAQGSDRRFAQQFLLGNSPSVDQVTVSLMRPQPAVSGSLKFELWRDNGSGQPIPVTDPGGKIADLGTIVDVTQIPVGQFGQFTFDNLVLGLEPHEPYWVVADYADVRGIGNNHQSIGFAVVFGGDPEYPDPPGYDATLGTNGAEHFHAYRNQDPFWNDLNAAFGLDHFYLAMTVEAMERNIAQPTLRKVGEPIWTVGDMHHFSASFGSDAGFQATVDKVSPPDTHCTPRDLPHDDLWAESIANFGFTDTTTFVPSDIDGAPNGIYTTVRLLPDPGEVGSSLSAESGPIIPVELLEIHSTWKWIRNGEVVDEGFSSDFGRPDCLVEGFDGLSSFQQISATDANYFPPETELVASYATELQIRDSQGNGWDVSIPFEVVDEIAGDIRFDGQLDTTDIDMLSSAIRQSLSDPHFDQNGDGQVNLHDRTHWVHSLANTYFGDANLDGEFNSSDMTLVFSAAEYEDNITLNSTWAEGDWNGDGDFDSSDLILAFQDGGYEQGPRADVQAVPEPATFVLFSLGLLAIVRCTRNRP
ncbi:MAG: PEP-CTERM sorting domain-containing protein [Pirellulaceae bacterium]